MEGLVSEISKDLVTHERDHVVNIRQLPLDPSHGDLSMIRQVWVNLISNAIKYSRKKDHSEIEIGSYRENGSICYYVSDNGAGFDMQYVNKLFGVFQRLHKVTEFEGTGVGLALVKTIVNRHHGNVWAEGKVDEGARFYFSLPLKDGSR
jgi:light-regulated signal transduction histidine kinase (bacteriophytochrome)